MWVHQAKHCGPTGSDIVDHSVSTVDLVWHCCVAGMTCVRGLIEDSLGRRRNTCLLAKERNPSICFLANIWTSQKSTSSQCHQKSTIIWVVLSLKEDRKYNYTPRKVAHSQLCKDGTAKWWNCKNQFGQQSLRTTRWRQPYLMAESNTCM